MFRLPFLGGVMLLLGVMHPAGAFYHPTSSSVTIAGQTCLVREVHLHGSNPATSVCLQYQSVPQQGVHPFTNATNCGTSNDLILYEDAFQKGAKICFTGTGFANLTDYPLNFLVNWNDRASSWSSGIWSGTFYEDLNGQGRPQNYTYFNTGEFDGSNNGIRNDHLTSFTISSSAPGH